MGVLNSFWDQVTSLCSHLFLQPDWRNMLDILIVSVLIYQVIKMMVHTRANSVLKGVGMVLVVTWLSEVLQLNALNWLLLQMINTGMLVLVVLFQPELRHGLDRIGRSRWLVSLFGPRKNDVNASHVVQELVSALTSLARRRVGALIVIQRETGLSDILASGTRLDAEISAPLIENIFEPNTPLHDGAVVICDARIAAAACILQLSEDSTISRELGTRHRAALGISESTDAVTLIVSEETGIISMAREGRLTRYLDAKSLTALLSELFLSAEPSALEQLRQFTWRAQHKEADDEK